MAAGDDVTGERLPFTKRERRKLSYQAGFGDRRRNEWGLGDLPAPWAEGDVVQLVGERPSRLMDLDDGPFYVVGAGFSIDDGDAWYFRLTDRQGYTSDRLHVAFAGRSTWDEDIDWMASFRLVDTSDPEGLAERERKLAEGWEWSDHCRCACHRVCNCECRR